MSTNNKLILVTGAAGYVGSHCLVELLKNNYDVVAIDNCSNAVQLQSNSMPESLARVEWITGRKLIQFYQVDISDVDSLERIFQKHRFDACMHFAALKAVGESCKIPLEYYRNNVGGTITLLETMRKHGVKKFIFSSSATVYGRPDYLPIDEKHPTGEGCTNPYGKSKYFIEEILKDVCASEKGWCVASLRYFNPVGAHESGEIGEDPQGIPNNLMPYISQVAVRRQPFLRVFGDDFNTNDGTGVRDYIHIMDLARGHLITLDNVLHKDLKGWNVYNFGAGTGFSVLDVIASFEESTGVHIPYKICQRRAGDVDELWADIEKAQTKLDWKPEWTLKDMCAHSWNWQSKYPMGYRTQRNVHPPLNVTSPPPSSSSSTNQNLNGSFKVNNSSNHHHHEDDNLDTFNNKNNGNGQVENKVDEDESFNHHHHHHHHHEQREHFLPKAKSHNGKTPPTTANGISTLKLLKGKCFALEVNNNEEDIIV